MQIIQENSNNNNSDEKVIVVGTSSLLEFPMMEVLSKLLEYENLYANMVEYTIILGVLCKYYSIVDILKNP